MKLDMNTAWNDAVAMVKANREVMVIVAGVFFFLPSLAAVFFIPQMEPPAAGADLETVRLYLVEYYSRNAVPFLLMGLASAVGFIALLALLRGDSKPTVGEAIKTGFTGLLPYIGAQLMVGIGAGLLVGISVGLPVALGLQGIAFFTMLAAVVVLIYVLTKLSLVMPVIAIERSANSIAVLRRSWNLTQRNSLRLFLFYFLFALGFLAVTLVIELFFGLAFSLLGEGTAANIANGSVSGVLSAGGSLLFAAVLAAVHRQLSGTGARAIPGTFG